MSPSLTLIGVEPSAGTTAGGETITISGSNLASATGVTFGETPATILSVTDTKIIATAPASFPETVDVTVTTPAGVSATTPAAQYTSTLAPPVLTSVNPTVGSVAGGDVVDITGGNFVNGATVSFAGTVASNVTVVRPTELWATAPSGSPGTVDVTVTTSAGTSAVGPDTEYTWAAEPAVSSISPGSGPAAGGTTVTITGTSPASANRLARRHNTFRRPDRQITATTPAAPARTVDVTVTSAEGLSDGVQYTYAPAPRTTQRLVTVSRIGSGMGRVTSTPPGIDCGSTRRARFPLGEKVTLRANPALRLAFARWRGAGCSGQLYGLPIGTSARATAGCSHSCSVWHSHSRSVWQRDRVLRRPELSRPRVSQL